MARLRQGLGAGVIGLSVTLGLLGPAASPAQAADAGVSRQTPAPSVVARVTQEAAPKAPKGKKLQLALTQVSPTSLTYQDDLVVSGTVRNPGNRAVKNLDVALRFSYTALTGRDAVTDWVSKGDVATTSAVLKQVTLKNVPAKGSSSFSFTVEAGSIGLSSYSSSFGPRPFSLVATSAQGKQLDTLRSTVIWAPENAEAKVGLTMLAALTSTVPSTTAGLPTEEAAAELLPSSRLSNILTASDDPAIGWAVDPALLASAMALRDNGITEETEEDAAATPEPKASASPSSPAGKPSATAETSELTDLGISSEAASTAGGAWLNRISQGRAKRTVIGLPYADTDLNSLLKGGSSPSLLRQSDKLGETIEQEALGKSLFSRIAWPADGVISKQALEGLAATRHESVILSAAQQQPKPELDYTPSGTSRLAAKDKELTGLLYDPELSSLFEGAGQDQGAETTQTMLATLAAISAEPAPDTGTRQVLAVAPRDWNPSPQNVQRLTAALRDASWVELSSLKNLGAATPVERAGHTYGKKAGRAELPKGNLSTAQAMDRDLDGIAPALIENQDVVRRLEQRIASLLSFAWRSDLDDQADARRTVMNDVTGLTGGVQLSIGDDKVFTARSAPISVVVVNDTDYPVRVSVSFRARSGQLKVTKQPEAVTIAAQHRQTFRVEARAIATGDVLVDASLLAGEGASAEVVGSPQTFEVKVRPNWESWGMIGMAVVLGLLLLVGLLRSFRRNRKRPKVPLNTVPDVDDEVTRASRQAAREAAREAAAETARQEAAQRPAARPIARLGDIPDLPDRSAQLGVTDRAPGPASGGATFSGPQGSRGGGEEGRTPGTGSASGNPGPAQGMHEQKSGSVPTMTAKGAERRSPTMPKENR
nr:DUF6049 family protein [Kineosporia rhizophila]